MRGHTNGTRTDHPAAGRSVARRLGLFVALTAAALLLAAGPASAAKQVINYFGTPPANVLGAKGGEFNFPGAIAVNQTGAGPAGKGDIYVIDNGNNRIERFSRDDHGTPKPADDTFNFISAWGTDVVAPGGTGDVGNAAAADYEICTVAEQCQAAVASAGNGTLAGDGDLGKEPSGIAVDSDSGEVYVTDAANHRVNVYAGDGAFLRSFGYDVAASGPGNLPGATEQQKVTVKATGGKFSLLFEGQSTGATGWGPVAAGSKTVTVNEITSGAFAVNQAFSAAGEIFPELFPTGTTIAKVEGSKLTLSKAALHGQNSGKGAQLFGHSLPFNASAAAVESALKALPTIGGAGGSVSVSRLEKSAEEFEYTIDFGGALAGTDLPSLASSAGGLTGGSRTASVEESAKGGAYEVCSAAAGDVCRAGGAGNGIGELGTGEFGEIAGGIAVSPPDGNPTTGTVFLADTGNQRVNTYGLDGSSPSSFGSAAEFGPVKGPSAVAVDSRGIVYAVATRASGGAVDHRIERYDTQNADGGGVGFLAPIADGVDEKQQFTISATAGQFRICFEGQCSGDLPFDATESQVRAALEALPTIGPGNVAFNAIGGPGDATGSHPYKATFAGGLGASDVPQLTIEDGSVPLSGGTGASVTTVIAGQSGLLPAERTGLYVRPDPDGPGPEGDILYAEVSDGLHSAPVQQFGPLNPPGQSTPPAAADEVHGGFSALGFLACGLALDEATGLLYVPDQSDSGQSAHGVYVLGNAGASLPTASIDSIDQITARSALVHATIDPNGPPDLAYQLEYSDDGGTTWKSTPEVVLGSQETPQAVQVALNLLEPGATYQVRLIAQRSFGTPVTDEDSFATSTSPPEVETAGSPVRTATTARLEGRVNPAGTATTYHFKYGEGGPCDANPCESTEAKAAGSADRIELLSQWVENLKPATTYHYRVVGESECEPIANPDHICASSGEEMTLTTPASDAPLSHGHFPGPPGSDRAYEQVNAPDIGGNPIARADEFFSEDGERAIYAVEGGTPFSASSSGIDPVPFFAQRDETALHQGAWQTRQITPPRSELIGNRWHTVRSTPDLSTLLGVDWESTTDKANVWSLSPEGQPLKLFQSTPATAYETNDTVELSADGSRAVMLTHGGELDPAYPTAAAKENLYDITSGAPRLLSLLPGNEVAACGLPDGESMPKLAHWVSADGSRVFFASQGNGNCGVQLGDQNQLYMRSIEAEETKLISGPQLSGLSCGAIFLRSTPDAAFLWTASRLAANDTAPAECQNPGHNSESLPDGDVYRYGLSDGAFKCVTCVVPGVAADVHNAIKAGKDSEKSHAIAVAEDGSRVYFDANSQLLPGAPQSGLYRVEVASGQLAYVGPSAEVKSEPAHPMTPDGSVIVFASSDPALNPLGGTDNGGTSQHYRYDDNDRSLICVSCSPHGSAPAGSALHLDITGPALSRDGSDVAFTTPTALVGADQNTAGPGQSLERGTDAYEWRDGRLLLISDGLTDWPNGSAPEVKAMSASGRDAFFTATAAYTPDALEASTRLYDARIGGGFEFPEAQKPCALEVCQGTPKGAPEEQSPGTADFRGPGNPPREGPGKCRKGKVRRKGRCVAKHRKRAKRAHHRRANHNRRAAR